MFDARHQIQGFGVGVARYAPGLPQRRAPPAPALDHDPLTPQVMAEINLVVARSSFPTPMERDHGEKI